MNILFIHQNMPAQFKHLAPALAADGHRVLFLTQHCRKKLPGVLDVTYPPPRAVHAGTHHYVRRFEDAVLHGQAVVRALISLRKNDFTPDLIIAHSGWGETLFLKDILPQVPVIIFAELSYRSHGLDVGFDPEEVCDLNTVCRTRARNAHLLVSLEAADAAVSPTHWQRDSHPESLRSKIDVIFDGIDFGVVRPRPRAQFTLPDGRMLRKGHPVITYVSRNLEPYRGFRTFMRAIPEIQRRRPDADILIVGGDEVSYGQLPKGFPNWRAAMAAEVAFDPARVHFLGRLPYDDYLDVLAVGAAHAYLTYPFVLSWSCIEAMAMGALVVGSNTGPVREVIRDGENGILTDFFDPAALADKLVAALDHPQRFERLRRAAVASVQRRYSVEDALPAWRALIERVAPSRAVKKRAAKPERQEDFVT
jgi:glycosyltransferase involved in cell wall biosynthesis